MQLKNVRRGFSLVELAVVLVIVGFLMVSGILAFNSQVDIRNYDETTRRLNLAAEHVIAFAIANRRLPCPAVTGSTGTESIASGTAAAGGTCSTTYGGFLPALTIGFPYYDSDRYAIDAYGNRIRYAIASTAVTAAGSTCSGLTPSFSSVANLKANGISCRPATTDLDVCTTAACTARVISQQSAVFVLVSTGKNGALTGAYVTDELENTDGDARFVSRTPGGGSDTFDDIVLAVPVGVLYSRLTAAGVLP